MSDCLFWLGHLSSCDATNAMASRGFYGWLKVKQPTEEPLEEGLIDKSWQLQKKM